jgi:DNA polymerase I-like protein with 3'-5' exonuclease and polymerase domains
LNLERPTTVDFETFPIEGRPDYPPVPVSVSIKEWGKKPKFFAWGHVNGGNTCTRQDAINALQSVWKGPLLFHHAKFDLSVATEKLGLPMPSWDHVHDTMFMLYLDDPRARSFALKPAGERLLGMAPEERDAVADWLCTHQPVPGRRLTPSRAGEFIALAPGNLVGPYANGDTLRTEGIFKYGLEMLKKRNMRVAYDRERRLLPILLENERGGVPIDLDRLRKDVRSYNQLRVKIDEWLKKQLKAGDINLNSADELGEALIRSGKADPSKLGRTAKGKVATNQEALNAGIKDRALYAMLVYRAQLNTCLGTFMEPWLAVAERTGGMIHTSWNQIRNGDGGTTTGRFSSTPNFQNIPNEFDQLFWSAKHPKLPKMPFPLLPLPQVRSYVVPGKGRVLLDRDYSQQEVRILGHYEDATLKQAYLDDPWMDAHDTTQAKLLEFGLEYDRKPVKNTNFGIIYGQGAPSLAVKNDLSIEDSRRLMMAIKNNVFPGLKDLFDDLKGRAKNDLPVRTWGGREYFCEEPMYSEKYGRWMTFDYKLLNLIIQGSAADCTKEALIRWNDIKHEDDRFLLSVHDQQTIDAPAKRRDDAMKRLKDAMESIEFDVPMLSEGKWSTTNWFELKDYDKRGKLICR